MASSQRQRAPQGPRSGLRMVSGIDRSSPQMKLLFAVPGHSDNETLFLSPLLTIAQVKDKLAPICGLKAEEQVLYFGKKALINGHSLKDYDDIESGSVIYVEPALLGGALWCNDTPCDCRCCECLSWMACCECCDNWVKCDKKFCQCGCCDYPWWVYTLGYEADSATWK